MNFSEHITMAFSSLKANKMRAFLTMLGIIIGISSVIMITTMGNIMTEVVNDAYKGLGVNAVWIYIDFKEKPERNYYEDGDFFTDSIIQEFNTQFADRVDNIGKEESVGNAITYINHENYTLSLDGVDAGYSVQSMSEIISGRFISDGDVSRMKQTCVISDKQAKKIYGNKNPIGQKLSFMFKNTSYEFTVVGVYKYTASKVASAAMSAGNSDWNSKMFIPISTAQKLAGYNSIGQYSSFIINGAADENVQKLSSDIAEFFNSTYYRNNNSIKVTYYSAEQEMNMFDDILSIVSTVITVIAGISLLVGGIGVMNIMLVSVTERTREIGVRKALGAPNSAIRMQFITESMIICLIGGIVGIIFGIILGNLAGLIVGTTAAPSIAAIIIAVTFSIAIGVFFGYYPANKAAKLDPIEALRYE